LEGELIMIHQTADVSPKVRIPESTKVWGWAQIREGAKIGEECIIGKSVSIDSQVTIGNRVKIQNNVSIYNVTTIEDGVFVGPHVCFTNDKYPRAVNPDMTPKGGGTTGAGWHVENILIKKGAAIGANSTLGPGVTIGEWALVGMGSVVTKDVPAHAMVVGDPARVVAFVCKCAHRLEKTGETSAAVAMKCTACGDTTDIPKQAYSLLQQKRG
jgi:acetyltransferase-like isoleucine patch superfamily enzyme